MYLSKLTLNPESRESNTDLQNISRLHGRLMSVFPLVDNLSPRKHHGLLYRIAEDNKSILVQSLTKPKWDSLPERYCDKIEKKEFNPNYTKEIYRFKLDANAIKKTNTTNGLSIETGELTRGKSFRKTLVTEIELMEWLNKKSISNGFKVKNMEVMINQARRDIRSSIVVHSVIYKGSIEVTDEILIKEIVKHGIGNAKSYGCGLLSLAKY
jgi:CRISPR system Cascade subunit CasE